MKELLELMWVAPLVAIGVTASFSLCVLGFARGADARRGTRGGSPTAWFALGILAGVAVVAEVVFGVGVIVAG